MGNRDGYSVPVEVTNDLASSAKRIVIEARISVRSIERRISRHVNGEFAQLGPGPKSSGVETLAYSVLIETRSFRT